MLGQSRESIALVQDW